MNEGLAENLLPLGAALGLADDCTLNVDGCHFTEMTTKKWPVKQGCCWEICCHLELHFDQSTVAHLTMEFVQCRNGR